MSEVPQSRGHQLRLNGFFAQSLVGLETMTPTKAVEVVTALLTFNPKHVYWGHVFFGVFVEFLWKFQVNTLSTYITIYPPKWFPLEISLSPRPKPVGSVS